MMNYKYALKLIVAGIVAMPVVVCAAQQSVKTEQGITVTGSQDLPNVLYIVPWQPPSIPKRSEHPPATELNEFLEPLQPKRFRQQLYFRENYRINIQSVKDNQF